MTSRLRIASTLLLLALMLSIIPSAVTAASAASTCDWAQFIADVTVPDGTNYAANTAFKKTWRLKNIGTCTWTTSYALVFDSGEKFSAPASVNFPINVSPGQTVDLSLDMTSPSSAGHYFSYWKLKNASGAIFGIGYTANKSFWAEINVTTTSGTGYDFTANATSAAWTSGAGALAFPGADGDARGFALKKDKPKFESGVESAQAGMLFAPQNITGGYIQAVYPSFRVQSGDRFQSTIGCEYGATTCYVAYRLDYQIGSGAVRTFWTFREKYEGWTYNVNLDLSSLAGYDVKFILVVNAYGSPAGDRALWGNPVIARAGGVIVTPSPTVTGTPPTPTPTSSTITPTITPMSTTCDRAQFISDVTVPDGTTFAPASTFKKTWRLKNVGTCTWTTGYALIFDTGEKMSGPDSAPMPMNVAPGQTVDISINLISPNAGGTYRGYWKFKNSLGAVFGIGSAGTKSFWVEIKVSGSTATPGTATATITPIPSVGGVVYDFAANACQGTWFSGAGQLPCPGTEGDSRGFVLKVVPSKLENGTSDGRMGLITFPQNINNGYIQGFFPSYNVKSGDRFRSIVNCEANATSCYVVFRLDYQTGTSSIQTFWAFVERYEGQFYQVDLDLSALVGKDVKFILTVLATGSPTGDRALWVAPMIFNPAGVATITPTLTPSPTLTPTITLTPTATLTPSPTGYKYDFGTTSSPLAAGYTRVTETTGYSAGSFGWTDISGLESRDRSAVADELNRDFVLHSSAARTFKVDLPNGNYSVSVTMGDNDYVHDNMVVKANGTTVLPDVDNAAGAFTTNTFTVTVSGGSLALEFSDAGGADSTWVVNAISITKTP
jgi:hypothetical protein